MIYDYLGKDLFTTVLQVREVGTDLLMVVSIISLFDGCNVFTLVSEINKKIAFDHPNLVKYHYLTFS